MDSSFTVYPAIDVRQGQVVRLAQGDYRRQTRYDHDPLALTRSWADEGAQWLHLVDLDAARLGGYTLLPLLQVLAAQTRIKVQTGGGVRSRDDVARLLDAGATRVVVGSVAVREPARVLEWISEFGAAHITVALDARRDEDGTWRLPVDGWTRTGAQTLEELVGRYRKGGLRHLLSTDISRDGMLAGPGLSLYARLRTLAPELAVQASGGVTTMADVVAVRAAGCAGIVLGRALLEGRLRLVSALAASPC